MRVTSKGQVTVNDVIAAELAPAFGTEADLWATLTGSEIAVQSFARAAVFLAGTAYRVSRRRGGRGVGCDPTS